MIRNYLKIAWRYLVRNKVYSFINITGLSFGLACAMLIILYTKDELSYDRFHKNGEQIYRITVDNKNPDGSNESSFASTGYFQGPRFSTAIPEIKSFVRLQSRQMDIKEGTEVKSREFHYVDPNFFSVFTFPLISGNPATALVQPNSIVISEEVAKRYFGKQDPMNKILQVKTGDNFENYIVSGVAKKCPQNSSLKFEMLLPIKVSAEDEKNDENWFNYFLNTFVVLDKSANPAVVEQKMKRLFEKDAAGAIKTMAQQYGVKTTVAHRLQPLNVMHLDKVYRADNGLVDASNPLYSYILTGIALFILLIACINFINLTVARSVKRAKEIGIRKVVGGRRKQLVFQFLGESFFICTAAFILAFIIVQLVLPTFNSLSNKALALSYLFDVKLVLGFLGLYLITGLLAGFYPALIISRFNPVQSLYNRFSHGSKNYLQKGLVVVQFSLATLLIIATITIYSQFNFLTKKKLGYDDKNLVNVTKFGLRPADVKLFKEQVMSIPGITDVTAKNAGSWGTIAKVNGEQEIQFAYETVDDRYIPLLKIPVIKGRNFSPDFPSDSTQAIVVNEAFVKKAGWKNPIGQQVNFWYRNNEKYTVVGVVKDYHYASLAEEIGPQLFTMKPGNGFGMLSIKIKPGSESAALKHIETTFKRSYPLNPYEYVFKDEQNRKNYEAEAKWKQMMLFGAILTIFISCIGLFGLSVLAAENRTKEIGIRKVLGASVNSVIQTLTGDFLKLVVLSFLIAMPLGWYAINKWLQSYPYRVEPGAWMFVVAAMVVIVIALITVSFQSVKAALANPVKSLRTE